MIFFNEIGIRVGRDRVNSAVDVEGRYTSILFRDFNVYKCFALFIRQVLPITTNTIQTFIHKFMEKGNSQQSNNNLKIYKKQCSHI
jgi:hypothetical protein